MKVALSLRVLVAILAIGIAVSGTLAGYYHDQSIKGVYASLEPQLGSLNSTVQSLRSEINSLEGQITSLQSASLDGWFQIQGSDCSYGCYANGAYSNHGTQDAKNIVLTLVWKNNGGFVQSNSISLGNLAGRSTALYPAGSSGQYFSLVAPANQLSWSFTWNS